MIPDNKEPAVKKALQAAFNTTAYEDIQQLTKGLSTALIFKITVRSKPYLLRVITRTDAFGDPSFYYPHMKMAAENGVAPRIHYMDIEDRVSITDFITEQPFSLATAKEVMPQLLRQTHSLPRFPIRNNYFDSMEKIFPSFRSANVLPDAEQEKLFAVYECIMQVYPRNDTANWVSAHNDSKPENIVFDGSRPWFVDWESAFLNDRYLDLAIVGNFLVRNDQEEAYFLDNYFQQPADEYQHARFFLMREILHFYYLIFLVAFDTGTKPIDLSVVPLHDFNDFHDGMWNGRISLADAATKRAYALLHLEQFKWKASTRRFEDSLQVLASSNR